MLQIAVAQTINDAMEKMASAQGKSITVEKNQKRVTVRRVHRTDYINFSGDVFTSFRRKVAEESFEPRILIVNAQSMYDRNATAITLRSIFSTYNSDKVMEVYYPQVEQSEKEHDIGIYSIKLQEKTFPINYFIRRMISRKFIQRYNAHLPIADIRSKTSQNSIRAKLKLLVLGLINCSPLIGIDKEIADTVDSFSPDVIYTLGGDIIPLTMALYFSKRYGSCPILIHYMDNWLETKYAGCGINRLFRHVLLKKLSRVQQCGNAALVISPMMAQHYDNLFTKIRHFPLMNCIDLSDYTNKQKHIRNQQTFVYAGGLHLNRHKQLIMIEKAIRIANETGENASTGKILIYTSEKDREQFEKCFDQRITCFLPYVPHNQIQIVYETADVLVHVEDFDPGLISFTKYSISTKISEYMHSGRPILCYAPKNIAVYKYIESISSGICASSDFELQNAIMICLNDESRLAEMGANGRKAALSAHSFEAGHNTLMRAIEMILSTKHKKECPYD